MSSSRTSVSTKPTVLDVAAAAKVSVGTVSRVLNTPDAVGAEMQILDSSTITLDAAQQHVTFNLSVAQTGRVASLQYKAPVTSIDWAKRAFNLVDYNHCHICVMVCNQQ